MAIVLFSEDYGGFFKQTVVMFTFVYIILLCNRSLQYFVMISGISMHMLNPLINTPKRCHSALRYKKQKNMS